MLGLAVGGAGLGFRGPSSASPVFHGRGFSGGRPDDPAQRIQFDELSFAGAVARRRSAAGCASWTMTETCTWRCNARPAVV